MSTNSKPYGPANPHPLSQLRTEPLWEEKYEYSRTLKFTSNSGLETTE